MEDRCVSFWEMKHFNLFSIILADVTWNSLIYLYALHLVIMENRCVSLWEMKQFVCKHHIR